MEALWGLLAEIADWRLADTLRRSSVVYPLVNAAHIFSIGILVGAIVTLDLRVLGLFRTYPIEALAPPLSQMAMAGVLLAGASGFLLFTVRPTEYAQNPAFLIKLGLVALGVANALLLRASRHWLVVLRGGERHALVTASVSLSLAVWASAVVAGRWIGFLQ
ncbi:hypothetical protein [Lutibaculum baratangense]|uniref:Putative membrane protein n=1 Tax=Lutibaculum baratangense AMV1 TaxID=631454 RepID=V4RUQ6_9HYPH|nr:hypothetical protein [Lutibaculum baratangense]ESR26810.1 putative membrane protein [Lutibaculum baratangense AMV1]